ncbi:hypothetical protein FQR65_LT01017 [Abscondita terminalis]|nr:hypothetical protein FQR65_LT01017 [Abscondita terminalis]
MNSLPSNLMLCPVNALHVFLIKNRKKHLKKVHPIEYEQMMKEEWEKKYSEVKEETKNLTPPPPPPNLEIDYWSNEEQMKGPSYTPNPDPNIILTKSAKI